jgi:Glycosyltransferase family 92
LHVFSAFYDDRLSLGTSSPQVAVIALADNVTDWCRLRFDEHDLAEGAVYIPATVAELGNDVKLFVCPLPANITVIPLDVALGWNGVNGTAPGVTRWRVPVEVIPRPASPDELILCLGVVYGRLDPQRVVEWLEIQRLIGVQKVVVYNWSMSADVDRVFVKYSLDGFVDLRQSNGVHLIGRNPERHKTVVINDCMYRYMGTYRYIAVMDLDEIIVPRQSFMTVPSLIRNLSASKRIGSFVFRNAHYFVKTLPDVDISTAALHSNPSLSTFLTKRRRAPVSQKYVFVKYVMDSNACIGAWLHFCLKYTKDFMSKEAVAMLNVHPNLAMKHHYRTSCNLEVIEEWKGACERAMQSAVVDNVVDKYASDLMPRLLKQCRHLELL